MLGFPLTSAYPLSDVPAIAIHPPDGHHNALFQALIHQHGADTVCVAFLLVHGRQALRAYNYAYGRHNDLLTTLLTDAVGTWADNRLDSRTTVSRAADAVLAHPISADTPTKTCHGCVRSGHHNPHAGTPQTVATSACYISARVEFDRR